MSGICNVAMKTWYVIYGVFDAAAYAYCKLLIDVGFRKYIERNRELYYLDKYTIIFGKV